MQNSVNLVGRLARDVEVRTFDSGDRLASFDLAVSRNYKNKNGEYECDFIKCQARNGTADLLHNYFKKGDFCPITGKLYTRKYEKDGQNHTVTYVQVEDITFTGSRKGDHAQTDMAGGFMPETPEEDDLPF